MKDIVVLGLAAVVGFEVDPRVENGGMLFRAEGGVVDLVGFRHFACPLSYILFSISCIFAFSSPWVFIVEHN